MRRSAGREWTVALAVKDLATAKSRLHAVAPAPRADLVLSMFADVLLAVRGCALVRDCLVVTPDRRVATVARRWGALVLAESGPGLNAAWLVARAAAGSRPLALVMPDLPLLTSAGLARVLAEVPADRPGFVADLSGHGTVLLASTDARLLRPKFGVDSAYRHREDGALDLTGHADPAIRCDVDTPTDLGALTPTPRSATGDWFGDRRTVART